MPNLIDTYKGPKGKGKKKGKGKASKPKSNPKKSKRGGY